MPPLLTSIFFFFNDTATTEIYTLSLHDALPISTRTVATLLLSCYAAMIRSNVSNPPRRFSACSRDGIAKSAKRKSPRATSWPFIRMESPNRSEEHTSELQSQSNLVCRLLLEKKNTCCTTLD